MTYRDRSIQCPRCGLELDRRDERDRWRCTKCRGVMFSVEEVIADLVSIAPDLVPEGRRAADLTTIGRRTVAPLLKCAVCGAEMEPVFLGGVEIDRCFHDQLLWFDGGEHSLVMDHARDQRGDRAKSWIARFIGEF